MNKKKEKKIIKKEKKKEKGFITKIRFIYQINVFPFGPIEARECEPKSKQKISSPILKEIFYRIDFTLIDRIAERIRVGGLFYHIIFFPGFSTI